MNYFKSFLLFMSLISCSSKVNVFQKPQILLLLAHYDDETMISRVLLQLKDKYDIYAIYLTRGEGGSDIRLSKPQSDNLGEDGLRKHLKKVRHKEMEEASKIFGIKRFFQLGFPDTPFRVPLAGYPNPKGKPTTDVNLFVKSKIWSLENLRKKSQQIIDQYNLSPDYLITMSDEDHVIHAHHQVTYKVAKLLKFKKGLKGIYGVLEPGWYDINKFKKRDEVLVFSSNDERLLSKIERAYKAHKSQIVSIKTRGWIKKRPDMLFRMSESTTNCIAKGLDFVKKYDFKTQSEWIDFVEYYQRK